MKKGQILCLANQPNAASESYEIQLSSSFAWGISDAKNAVNLGVEVVYVCEIKAVVRRSVAVEE